MRQILKDLDRRRDWFSANFVGTTADPSVRSTLGRSPKTPLVLLRNIMFLQGKETLADHVWIPEWCLKNRDVQPDDRICFLATVLAYYKGKPSRFDGDQDYNWDYGLGQVIWVQRATNAPAQLPALTIPQTKREAERLLSWAMLIHQQSPDRYPLDDCNDWGIRLHHWDEKTPAMVEGLVLEGWAEPNPSPDDYWLARSPALRQLDEHYPRASLSDWAAIACLVNGLPPSEVY